MPGDAGHASCAASCGFVREPRPEFGRGSLTAMGIVSLEVSTPGNRSSAPGRNGPERDRVDQVVSVAG